MSMPMVIIVFPRRLRNKTEQIVFLHHTMKGRSKNKKRRTCAGQGMYRRKRLMRLEKDLIIVPRICTENCSNYAFQRIEYGLRIEEER